MAVRDIRTTLTLDGEKQFNQEIAAAARNLRVMGSEMKAASAQYDVTGDRTAYLASRSATLKNQLAQQRAIFDALSGAVRSSAQSTGEASSKTDGYRIRLNNTAAAMAKLEREIRDTDAEMEALGRESAKTGRQIEQGIGEAAKDAAQSLDEMYEKLRGDIGSIGGSAAASAVTDLGGAIIGTLTSVNSFAEESREFNRQISFLEQNAAMAKLDFGTVKGLLLDVTGLTGDLDGAFEGVSAMLAAGFDTDEMQLAIESLGGAVIKFPETMKFENLAESLQESIAAGEATGAFAELIERMGGDVGDFANAMAAAKTEEEKQMAALAYLNSLGLRPVYKSYTETNEQLTRAEKATQSISMAWAELGGTIDTWLTPIKEGIAATLTEINRFINEGPTAAQSEGARRLDEALKASSSGLGGFAPEDHGWYEGASDAAGLITGSNAELREAGAQMIDEAKEDIGGFFGGLIDGFMTGLLGSVWTGEEYDVMDYFDITPGEEELTQAQEAGKEIAEARARGEQEAMLAYAESDAVHAMGLQGQYDTLLREIAETEKEAMHSAGEQMAQEAGEGGAQAGDAATDALCQAFMLGETEMGEAAGAAGENAGISLTNKLVESGQDAIDAAADIADGINAQFARIRIPDLSGVNIQYNREPGQAAGGRTPGTQPTFQVKVMLDGREMGGAIASYVSREQGKSMRRAAAIHR